MKQTLKPLMLFGIFLLAAQSIISQSIPTLEMQRNAPPLGNSNYGLGSSILPVVTGFRNDALNNSAFSAYTPTSTFTVALSDQQFATLNYGTANYNGTGISTTQTTGLVFGIGPSLSSDPLPQGGNPYNRYNLIGEYGGNGGPTNAMFTSNPTAAGAQLGTGLTVANAGLNALNGGVEIFTAAQALYNNPAYPVGSRAYFGEVKISFSQPVKNPVIHVAGLGGSYRYLPFGAANIPANYVSTFFTTELELVTPGVSSSILSGNSFLALSGNNIINNNHTNPNGGSVLDPTEFIDNLGAATGSIKITGIVQELVYKVYLQSGSASAFAWSAPGTNVLGPGAPRDPFTGDIWYLAASYDKPLGQITGNVFDDRDGLTDNNINQSAGLPNPKTNAGSTLYANLVNASTNLVIATMPISVGGQFLFDNVSNGVYSVQVSSNQGTVGVAPPAAALPPNWVRTGEFNGAGPGSDGTVNGMSVSFNINNGGNTSQHEVNFGIEQLPETYALNGQIPQPSPGTIITLNNPPLLPILQGSDPEDMPAQGVLTNKTVKITTLPTNSTLRYNGVAVTVNQVIPNFNPALLTIIFNLPTNLSFTQFNYAYVDAAGNADPTPALYRIVWSPGGLPITLTEFTASKIGCTANLVWKTSSEVNGDRFEVEVNTTGNAVYTMAGTVAAAGNSSTPKAYQYSYAMQPGVTYYFRLKMVDKDGSYKYSETRSASCFSKGGIIMAPNPVISKFTISGMESGKNTILIYGANGQLVKTQMIAQTQGEINIYKLTPGMYAVKVTSEAGNVFVGKIIKQ